MLIMTFWASGTFHGDTPLFVRGYNKLWDKREKYLHLRPIYPNNIDYLSCIHLAQNSY
jgi:hypothetical protein